MAAAAAGANTKTTTSLIAAATITTATAITRAAAIEVTAQYFLKHPSFTFFIFPLDRSLSCSNLGPILLFIQLSWG